MTTIKVAMAMMAKPTKKILLYNTASLLVQANSSMVRGVAMLEYTGRVREACY